VRARASGSGVRIWRVTARRSRPCAAEAAAAWKDGWNWTRGRAVPERSQPYGDGGGGGGEGESGEEVEEVMVGGGEGRGKGKREEKRELESTGASEHTGRVSRTAPDSRTSSLPGSRRAGSSLLPSRVGGLRVLLVGAVDRPARCWPSVRRSGRSGSFVRSFVPSRAGAG
jgi:hypothetical protein